LKASMKLLQQTAISRSALEQHIRCPRCFYLQRRLGLKPPSMVPLTLAVATDALLKNEFDAIRASGASHAIWQQENLPVKAYQHDDIDLWRNNFKGMRITHSTGATIFGAIDDIWQNLETGELHIVDYKSTSKQGEPSLDSGFGDGYKRQMEIYQWLFRNAGFSVSGTGYFLYVNGSKAGGFYDSEGFGLMRFSTTLIAYAGDDSWVDGAVSAAVTCLQANALPETGPNCDSCRYYEQRAQIEQA
jgi:hypothetical protein